MLYLSACARPRRQHREVAVAVVVVAAVVAEGARVEDAAQAQAEVEAVAEVAAAALEVHLPRCGTSQRLRCSKLF